MTTEELEGLVESHKGLIGYDFVIYVLSTFKNNYEFGIDNQLLIYLQDKRATHIHSQIAWESLGYKLKDNAKVIYVLDKIYRVRYYDSNGYEVDISDISHDEIDKAISLGIYKKQKIHIGNRLKSMFDISDVEINQKSIDTYRQYKEIFDNQWKIDINSLLKCFSLHYKCKLYKSENEQRFKFKYSKINGVVTPVIILGLGSYNDKITELFKLAINSELADTNLNRDTLVTTGNLALSMLLSLYGDNWEIDKEAIENLVNTISSDNIYHILVLSRQIIEKIIFYLPNNGMPVDSTFRKAAQLYNIMMANSVFSKLKGD